MSSWRKEDTDEGWGGGEGEGVNDKFFNFQIEISDDCLACIYFTSNASISGYQQIKDVRFAE